MRIHTRMSWLSSICLNFLSNTNIAKNKNAKKNNFDTKYHLFLRDTYAITIVPDNQY